MTTGDDNGYRPVVAVDVDGVLRLRNGKAADADRLGAFPAKVTVRRDAYPHVFHSPPMWNDDGVSTTRSLFSGVGAAWVRSLLDRGVEVVWATTWQEHANTYFAPILGIPPLPVAVRGDREEEWGPAEWKSVRLAAGFPGRPLLWVDDMPPEWAGYQLDALRKPNDRALTRLQWIRDPAVGITPDDVVETDEWLELASTPDGQRELRRRRRRERQYRRDEADRLAYGSRSRGRQARRIRATLFAAIATDGYAATDNITRHLLDQDDPDLALVREIASEWLADDDDVDAVVAAVAAQTTRGAPAPAADGRSGGAHPRTTPGMGAGGAR